MITVSDLKNYLNIDSTTNDTFLSVCVASAEAWIENYCNRSFEYGQYTDYLDGSYEYGQYFQYFDRSFTFGGYSNYAGNYDTKVFLINFPLKSVDKVEILNIQNYNTWDNLFTGGDSTANSIYIYPDINAFELINHYHIPKHRKTRITYTSGFNTDTYPDIKMVLLEIASTFYFNSPVSGDARLGMGSKNLNASTTQAITFKDLTPNWKNILKHYRLTRN